MFPFSLHVVMHRCLFHWIMVKEMLWILHNKAAAQNGYLLSCIVRIRHYPVILGINHHRLYGITTAHARTTMVEQQGRANGRPHHESSQTRDEQRKHDDMMHGTYD